MQQKKYSSAMLRFFHMLTMGSHQVPAGNTESIERKKEAAVHGYKVR